MSRRKKKGRPVSGWLVFDKPVGMGSTEAVSKVKWLYQAEKAGHAGTLDPLASGMLPIALGEATKTVPYVMEGAKIYRFTVAWGEERLTDDLEGGVTKSSDERPTQAQILGLLPKYTGLIMQVPPLFSAIKIDGERAYDRAREGESFDIPPREVEIGRLELIDMPDAGHAVFEVECGKGTYVRSMARDMGRDLGCFGHVAGLRRTEVYPFTPADLVTLETLEAAAPARADRGRRRERADGQGPLCRARCAAGRHRQRPGGAALDRHRRRRGAQAAAGQPGDRARARCAGRGRRGARSAARPAGGHRRGGRRHVQAQARLRRIVRAPASGDGGGRLQRPADFLLPRRHLSSQVSGMNAPRTRFVTRSRAPVGSPPGTLVPDASASPTNVRLMVINDDSVADIPDATLDQVKQAIAKRQRIWIDVVGLANLELITAVGDLVGFSPLALEDITTTDQRPKVDIYEEHPLIIVHMFDGKSVASKEQLSIVFDETCVVTFQERAGDCLDPVRKRLAMPTGNIRKRGPAYLVYAILDTILDAYYPMLELIGEQLEDLEDKITTEPDRSDVPKLHRIKRDLMVVKRALWPAREMLSAMTREELGLIPHEVEAYLRDTYDHAMQLVEIVETYRELSMEMLDLYLSSLSNRTNEVMRVLTIISTIFIPLSFLVGVWGMNFDQNSPWNMPELRFRYGYPVALAAMAAVVIGLLYVFRRKKWL